MYSYFAFPYSMMCITELCGFVHRRSIFVTIHFYVLRLQTYNIIFEYWYVKNFFLHFNNFLCICITELRSVIYAMKIKLIVSEIWKIAWRIHCVWSLPRHLAQQTVIGALILIWIQNSISVQFFSWILNLELWIHYSVPWHLTPDP